MFGRSIPLFKLFGIQVKLDPSWFLIAVLLTFVLATTVFPTMLEGLQKSVEQAQGTERVQELEERIPESLSQTTYWVMGVAGALLLFASILAHEFGHAIVANRRGLPVRGITLFLFGGVAELSREPDSAKNEFWMAIAGPIVSVALGVGFFVVAAFPLPAAAWMVVQYLAVINIVVVVFNMIPAYPLDGGRVLRSILWGWKGDLRSATRTAAGIGAGFGLVLMIFAGVRLVLGDFIGAAFTFLIGMFIRGASGQARQQIEIRTALSGKPVRELMNDQPRTVPLDEPLDRFVEDHVYRHHLKMFPVTRDGSDQLEGCISVEQLKEVPREQWGEKSVRDLADACTDDNTIPPDADASEALMRMSGTGRTKLMVVSPSGELVGVLTLKDLMGHVQMREEVEGFPG